MLQAHNPVRDTEILSARLLSCDGQMACLFLDKIPLEIRDEVYSYLLSIDYTKRPVGDDEKPSRVKRGLGCGHLYDLQPAVLRTNKQINKEARRFLYNDNLFVLVKYPHVESLDLLWTEELTLLAAEEDEVRSFRSALRISLHVDLCIHGNDNMRLTSQFVIAANDLSVFCSILKKIDNEGPGLLSSLKLILQVYPLFQLDVDAFAYTGPSSRVSRSPRSLAQQRRLLEPFATLRSMTLEIADVDGETQYIDVQLMEDIKERAGRPPYSMKEVLDTSARIKEQGNQAFRAGDFAHANTLYKSALENLNAGERYLDTDIQEGEFTEQTYFEAHFSLAFRIWSNTVATHLRLQQWTAAHEKAIKGIEKIETVRNAGENIVFGPGEVAKLYFRRALASEGMGKINRAVEEVRTALDLDPNSAQMKAKLREWKLQAKDPKQVEAALRALTV